jgi:hypothetical protein
MSYKTETQQVSAQQLNSNFVRKIEEGRIKEASVEGSAFIRAKLRQESFAREIITPVMLQDDELDRDEFTDLPKKIVEKEPDSIATFVPFKGTGKRTWFKGPRYSIYFGKTESQRFTKSKFELMTYQNDIRKILSDNSVKDMADQEDKKFYDTCKAIVDANAAEQNSAGTGLTGETIAAGLKKLVSRKIPVGKLLMTKELFYDVLKLTQTQVGSPVASRHYDEGIESEDKLYGIPVITTIKNDILPNNVIYAFGPENYLGNFYLLQDATLFIKQEADIIEFWSYAAPGIGIGNSLAMQRITVS